MITNLFINLVVLILGAIFSLLPTVSKLPTIFGFDIDTAMVSGVGQLNVFTNALWPIHYIMLGFLAILGYYVVKAGVRFLIGHRTPGN